jgi:hypothetical protein
MISNASPAQLAQQYSPAASRNKIAEDWKMPLLLFLPESMKPADFSRTTGWYPKVLDTLGILSGITLGQGLAVRDVLVEVVMKRIESTEEKSEELQVADVLNTI